jgi:hypothetical protein
MNVNLENTIPGMTPKTSSFNTEDYSIKYFKANLDEPSEVLALQDIESKAIRGKGEIILLSTDKMSFMDKYFVVLRYMERNY